MKTVDLSHYLEKDMPSFPGLVPPEITQACSFEAGDPYQLITYKMNTHHGTHIDCGAHLVKGGFYADREDLEFFFGKGIVIDCTGYTTGDTIGMEAVQNYDLDAVEFILFYCNWDGYWGEDKFWTDYPLFDEPLLAYLGEHETIRGLGVEFPNLDPADSADFPLHKVYMNHGKAVIENLVNLDQLLDKTFTFYAVPLKFKAGDGSPVRAFAVLDE